ncbi:MAG: FAD-dependent monooxygenase [Chitinophaga sp.]|uniref:FAD-dependent monooxygenase n=1 Tax=Chitinophaga sp. TaxID=1869181 RepID=UPI001B12996E|nr:FAD-dependent monooxygenase [Chitinophaga sp.]MBO9732998.1 FAD-dependent monooxygenase [Chitinophaga sp.]
MEIAIIGAGIGGLTTALALKAVNIPFKVYEAAPELKAVGAGIILANNAMQVYRHLGVHEGIARLGNRISVLNITQPNLRMLSSSSLQPFEDKFHLHNIAVHRADLHHFLSEAIGMGNIALGKKLKKISRHQGRFTLEFEDGNVIDTENIIGADGIRSVVRQQLFGESEMRDSKQFCWRGVVDADLPQQYHHELNELWGKGKRFGFVKLNGKQVYWYLLADTALMTPGVDPLVFLNDFHPLAKQLVQATPKDKWIAAGLFDLAPIPKWYMEGVCLLGDAAHATTPNLGQGACQAIEDAYVIGALLKKNYSIREAFRRYPAIRMKKARHIVNTSWKIGKMAHWQNPFAIALRNALMKSTPASTNNKQLGRIFELDSIV